MGIKKWSFNTFFMLLWRGLLVVLSIVIASLYSDSTLFAAIDHTALTNGYPTDVSSWAQGQDQSNTDDQTRMVLIHSNHGIVDHVQLALYLPVTRYTRPVAVNLEGGSSTNCIFDKIINGSGDSNSKMSAGKNLLKVTFNGSAPVKSNGNAISGGDVRTYGGACNVNDQKASNMTFYISPGVINDGNNISNSYTNGQYRLVVADISLVASSGGLKLKNSDGSAYIPGNGDYQGSLTFSVSAPGGILIGNYNTTQSDYDANNSLVGKRSGNQDVYIEAVYPFGLSCSQGDLDNQKVTVFDADNGQSNQPKDLYFYITDNGTRIAPNSGGQHGVSIGADGKKIIPTVGGEDKNSHVFINMKATHKYTIEVHNLYKGSHNYIYVGLPGNSIFGASNFSCGSPYRLIPSISVSGQNVAVGQAVSITGSVKNTVKTSAGTHSWHIDMKKYAPGVAVPAGGATTNSSQYTCSGSDCTQDFAGEYDDSFGGNVTKSAGPSGAGTTYTIASPKDPHDTKNDPIGTSYCYWTSVQSPTQSNSGEWAHSAPACFIVGVYPSVQFLGYDVKTGGLAVAHPFTIGSGTYGSWGEFGVFSRGVNTGFASGAGLAGNSGSSSSNQKDWSSLTFANCQLTSRTCPVSNYFGNFGNTVIYPSGVVAGLANLCNSGNTVPDGTTISSNSNIAGTRYICSNGTVTIGGDQTYASANTSDTSLPQQIIIANGIRIASGVQTVNSWLIATGTTISNTQKGSAQGGVINTCSDATTTTKLTTNICSKRLAVVGPVITKEVDLLRTYYKMNGATYDPTVSAETFNLRADAFLWAYQGNGNGTPIAQTTSVTDLPPRF